MKLDPGLIPFLVGGLMKAKPQDFLDMSASPVEVTMHFPADALVGLDEVATQLEKLGFNLGDDRIAVLEQVVGAMIVSGATLFLEVINGLIEKGKAPQTETEGIGRKSNEVVAGQTEAQGKDQEG